MGGMDVNYNGCAQAITAVLRRQLLLRLPACPSPPRRTHLQILLKKPLRCAFFTMSPRSSRMARMNWKIQIEASAGVCAEGERAFCVCRGVYYARGHGMEGACRAPMYGFEVIAAPPMASLLFWMASMFTRRPTGSSSDQREWTPIPERL